MIGARRAPPGTGTSTPGHRHHRHGGTPGIGIPGHRHRGTSGHPQPRAQARRAPTPLTPAPEHCRHRHPRASQPRLRQLRAPHRPPRRPTRIQTAAPPGTSSGSEALDTDPETSPGHRAAHSWAPGPKPQGTSTGLRCFPGRVASPSSSGASCSSSPRRAEPGLVSFTRSCPGCAASLRASVSPSPGSPGICGRALRAWLGSGRDQGGF